MTERSQETQHRGTDEDAIKALVVDDSDLVRMMISAFLTKAGHAVQEAVDGKTALRMLQQEDFDVAVTDLQMPVLDGFGLIEQSKALGISTEFVILTGARAGEASAAVRALRLGAHDFLCKPPSNPAEVILAVARAAEKKRLRDANVRLLEELKAQVTTDALTGIGNRRAFDQALSHETARVDRYGVPLSLVLLDLDHFKRINDTHGHPAGDAVLRSFAKLLGETIRESDQVYRCGGEEFAVLMPQTTSESAIEAARRIVAAVAFSPIDLGATSLRVTCSAGVAAIGGSDGRSADIVGDADVALYRAKSEGRNRARGRLRSASLSVAS